MKNIMTILSLLFLTLSAQAFIFGSSTQESMIFDRYQVCKNKRLVAIVFDQQGFERFRKMVPHLGLMGLSVLPVTDGQFESSQNGNRFIFEYPVPTISLPLAYDQEKREEYEACASEVKNYMSEWIRLNYNISNVHFQINYNIKSIKKFGFITVHWPRDYFKKLDGIAVDSLE